jgi:hypothetical protein
MGKFEFLLPDETSYLLSYVRSDGIDKIRNKKREKKVDKTIDKPEPLIYNIIIKKVKERQVSILIQG